MELGGVLSNPARGSISETMVDESGRQSNRPAAGSTFALMMEPTDLKSNRFARLPGGRMSLDDAARSA